MANKPNPRRQNGHRRDELRKRVLARDKTCWLCKEWVDQSIKTPDPMSPEVHELIAVSRGGSPYSPSNCVLTHRLCNRWIGNRTPDEVFLAQTASQAVRTGYAW